MDDILLGTRKGLFAVRGGEIARVSFLGAPVTAVLSRQEQDVKGTDKSRWNDRPRFAGRRLRHGSGRPV